MDFFKDFKISNLLPNLVEAFAEVWHYKIIEIEKNPITIGTLSIGILLMGIGVYCSKKLSKKMGRKLLKHSRLDISSLHTIEVISFYILLSFFTLFALKMANIPITIFTVLGGAFAIGIGFGSQKILNNLISGLILMMERPIKVGDFIEVDGTFGRVEDIGTRSTMIHSFGNKHIIIPNSFFLEQKVLNWTHDDHFVRQAVTVGVAYASDPKKVEQVLEQAVKDCQGTIRHHDILIMFEDFADSSLNFKIYYWARINEIMDLEIISSRLRHIIFQSFKDAHIAIPFPQRDIHLQQTQ